MVTETETDGEPGVHSHWLFILKQLKPFAVPKEIVTFVIIGPDVQGASKG